MRTNAAEYLLAWVWQTTWQSALLAIAVWTTTRVLRRWLTPQATQLLWLLVFLRLVMPSLPGSRFSVFSWIASDTPPANISAPAFQPVAHHLPLVVQTDAISVSPSAFVEQQTPRTFSWPEAWLTIWVAVSLILFVRVVISNFRFAKRLRNANIPVDVSVGQIVRDCCSQLGIRRIPAVLHTDLVTTPSLFGVFRPRLILPAGNMSKLDAAEMRLIINHELEHMRRHHLLMDWILTAIRCVHWFNPFAWKAHQQIRAARELICDRSVLTGINDDLSRRYGLAMLDLAAGIGRHKSVQIAAFAQEGNDLQQRIDAIVSRRHRYVAGLGLAVAATLAVFFLTRPQPKTAIQTDKNEPTSKPSAKPIASLVIEARQLTAEHEYRKALAVIDQILAVDPKNDYGLGARPLLEDRALIQEQIQARKQYDDRIAAAARQRATTRANSDNEAIIVAMERKLPEIKFDQVPLSDAIEFVRDVAGVSIFVNWRALDAAGVDKTTPVTARLRDVKFSKALDTILRDVGGGVVRLGYSVDEGVLTISTTDDLASNVVTNVYDIRDLIAAVDPKQKASLTTEFINLIQDTIATDSWKERGGKIGTIRELSGQFIITQTPDNQRTVMRLFEQLRETRAIQISLELMLIEISPEQLNRIQSDMGKAGIPTTSPQISADGWLAGPLLLDDFQLKALLPEKPAPSAATRVTLFNAQDCDVPLLRGESKIKAKLQATISSDRRSVTVTTSSTGTSGQISLKRPQLTFAIPDGANSIVRISPSDQPNTGNLWLTIKPMVIIQREAAHEQMPIIQSDQRG